jgi:hypothetical protein
MVNNDNSRKLNDASHSALRKFVSRAKGTSIATSINRPLQLVNFFLSAILSNSNIVSPEVRFFWVSFDDNSNVNHPHSREEFNVPIGLDISKVLWSTLQVDWFSGAAPCSERITSAFLKTFGMKKKSIAPCYCRQGKFSVYSLPTVHDDIYIR